MPLVVVKLVLTPLLIGGASLVARRWGPAIGGLLVALPLTSGPIAFFLAVEQGPDFAIATMPGMLAGLVAIAAFSVGYALVGPRRGPWAAFAVASAAYVAAGVVLQPVLGAPAVALFLLALAASIGAVRVLPEVPERAPPRPSPRWEIPARMLVGTGLVVLLTAVAPALGPRASGIVATFPVYVAVLAVFGQLHGGPGAAIDVLRGLLAGLPGTAAFYLVVALGLDRLGIPVTFALAVAAALGIAALALRRIRGTSRREVEPEPA